MWLTYMSMACAPCVTAWSSIVLLLNIYNAFCMQCTLSRFLIRKVNDVGSVNPSKISEWVGQTLRAWCEPVVIDGGCAPR